MVRELLGPPAMRAPLLILVAALPRFALADAPSDSGVGLYSELAATGYSDGGEAGTVEIGAVAGAYTTQYHTRLQDNAHVYYDDMRIEARATGALRFGAGTTAPFAATGDAQLALISPITAGREEGHGAVLELHADHAATPQLTSPRDLLGATFDQVGFLMGTHGVEDTAWYGDTLGGGIDMSYLVQDGHQRIDGHGMANFYRWCSRENGRIVGCLGLFDQEIEWFGPPVDKTATDLAVLGFWPLPIMNVVVGGLRIDARAGGLVATASTGMPARETGHVGVPAYDVRATGSLGPIELELRAARRMRLTMDTEVVRDDRIDLTARWNNTLVPVTAHAFAALTRTWADNFAQSTRAVTGGGDLELSHAFSDWRLSATAAAARTFYPSPLTAAPEPVFAATGTVAVRYQWREALAFLARP
jgi:hypothetical protein